MSERTSDRVRGLNAVVLIVEFQVSKPARKALEARLRAAGAHAYGDSFQDPAGFLFHFV